MKVQIICSRHDREFWHSTVALSFTTAIILDAPVTESRH